MSGHIPKRQILKAIDIESGELINAATLDDKLYAKHSRRSINNKSDNIYCLKCEGELGIMPNNKNKDSSTYFFYHKHNFSNCDLVNGSLSKDEADKLNGIYQSKETPRHKELKRLIFEKLFNVDFVDKESIKVEKWIFEDGKLQRRPDVSCIYKGKKVAFEVQVSELSQTYMLERYNFYKNQQIHLIWIVDQFSFQKNWQFIRDIQELNNYENVFRLNESSSNLEFICNYPKLSINKIPEVIERISEEIVPFSSLNFDNNYQVFFYDYPNELRHLLKEKDEIIKENESRKIRKEEERKLQEEQNIKDEESYWQNAWISRTEKLYKANNNNNLYLTEHCYFHISPNEKLTVFFPEKRISKGAISEIERNNSTLLWVVNSEKSFKKGDIKSKVTVLLNELEDSFPKELRENLKTELEDAENDLGFKINNTKLKIERSKEKLQESQQSKNSIVEMREEFISKKGGFDCNINYNLKRSLTDKFNEQIQKIEKSNQDITSEIKIIDKTLEYISGLKDAEIHGKRMKILSVIPNKNDLRTHFSYYAIVRKETFNTFYPEIVTLDKLEYAFYKPNDYVFMCDYKNKIDNLNLKKSELNNLCSTTIKELDFIKVEIDKDIENFILKEIDDLNSKIHELESEFKSLQAELGNRKETYSQMIERFDKDRNSIMVENKGFYFFTWNDEIGKWRDRKYPVFFDTNEGYLFWQCDEFQLKKVSYFDFIEKLGSIKNTLKKSKT